MRLVFLLHCIFIHIIINEVYAGVVVTPISQPKASNNSSQNSPVLEHGTLGPLEYRAFNSTQSLQNSPVLESTTHSFKSRLNPDVLLQIEPEDLTVSDEECNEYYRTAARNLDRSRITKRETEEYVVMRSLGHRDEGEDSSEEWDYEKEEEKENEDEQRREKHKKNKQKQTKKKAGHKKVRPNKIKTVSKNVDFMSKQGVPFNITMTASVKKGKKVKFLIEVINTDDDEEEADIGSGKKDSAKKHSHRHPKRVRNRTQLAEICEKRRAPTFDVNTFVQENKVERKDSTDTPEQEAVTLAITFPNEEDDDDKKTETTNEGFIDALLGTIKYAGEKIINIIDKQGNEGKERIMS